MPFKLFFKYLDHFSNLFIEKKAPKYWKIYTANSKKPKNYIKA